METIRAPRAPVVAGLNAPLTAALTVALMIASPLVAGAVTPEDLLVTVEPGGYIQIDGRAFQDPPPDRLDTFAVRRARLDIDGNW
jgi:hypothetical protein